MGGFRLSDLYIYGNGEMANMAFFYFKKDKSINAKAFVVDDSYYKDLYFNKVPIIPYSEYFNKKFYSNSKIHVALSYRNLNKNREKIYNHLLSIGCEFENFIHSTNQIYENVEFGKNCFILENQTIQPHVKINDNVILWSGNHIGHNSTIDSHTYISSQVTISGFCNIGKRCFFGVNSSVADFIEIGNDCFISMGSSVNKKLKNESFVINSKSTIYDKDHKISKFIKKNYFYDV